MLCSQAFLRLHISSCCAASCSKLRTPCCPVDSFSADPRRFVTASTTAEGSHKSQGYVRQRCRIASVRQQILCHLQSRKLIQLQVVPQVFKDAVQNPHKKLSELDVLAKDQKQARQRVAGCMLDEDVSAETPKSAGPTQQESTGHANDTCACMKSLNRGLNKPKPESENEQWHQTSSALGLRHRL